MKKNISMAAWLLAGTMVCACSDTWDDHYVQQEVTINNSQVETVNQTAEEYLASTPSLEATYRLFKETGVIDRMLSKESTYTILAVANAEPGRADEGAPDSDDVYKAETHVSDVSMSPSNLGDRMFMWSGKYINVTKSETTDGSLDIRFNNAAVLKAVKLNNGYLYYIDQEVVSPRSLYEKITSLSDDYSIFRDLVTKRFTKVFDERASEIIGFDQTGNTIYDSVFKITAPYFADNGLDIMSENIMATVLLPSNQVIEEARAEAKASLQEWGMTRVDSILDNWIFQSAFFKNKMTSQDFADNEDLTSVFKKQWRTTVQQVNLNEPEELSNGVMYKTTKLKFPTNVLVYRLKDYFKYYEQLTQADKDTYYVLDNFQYTKIESLSMGDKFGWPQGGFPLILAYDMPRFDLVDATVQEASLDFTAFRFDNTRPSEGKNYTLEEYIVPAGEYDVCLGMKERQKDVGEIDMYVNDQLVKHFSESELGKAGTCHYDRTGGAPEGWDEAAATAAGYQTKGKYDRDGKVIGRVVIGQTGPLKLRFESKGKTLKCIRLYHWCLKPTKDNY